MKKLLIASATMIALASGARADVQISMQPGSQCWSYQGRDTRFYGSFSGGQALTVAVVEQQTENDGMRALASNGESVWVNGPDGYFKDGYRDAKADDPFIYTDKPGRYTFNLYEHGTGAEYPVFVTICAMKRDRAKTK
jgi:hypothetical protein